MFVDVHGNTVFCVESSSTLHHACISMNQRRGKSSRKNVVKDDEGKLRSSRTRDMACGGALREWGT